jgi:hypothetical protein
MIRFGEEDITTSYGMSFGAIAGLILAIVTIGVAVSAKMYVSKGGRHRDRTMRPKRLSSSHAPPPVSNPAWKGKNGLDADVSRGAVQAATLSEWLGSPPNVNETDGPFLDIMNGGTQFLPLTLRRTQTRRPTQTRQDDPDSYSRLATRPPEQPPTNDYGQLGPPGQLHAETSANSGYGRLATCHPGPEPQHTKDTAESVRLLPTRGHVGNDIEVGKQPSCLDVAGANYDRLNPDPQQQDGAAIAVRCSVSSLPDYAPVQYEELPPLPSSDGQDYSSVRSSSIRYEAVQLGEADVTPPHSNAHHRSRTDARGNGDAGQPGPQVLPGSYAVLEREQPPYDRLRLPHRPVDGIKRCVEEDALGRRRMTPLYTPAPTYTRRAVAGLGPDEYAEVDDEYAEVDDSDLPLASASRTSSTSELAMNPLEWIPKDRIPKANDDAEDVATRSAAESALDPAYTPWNSGPQQLMTELATYDNADTSDSLTHQLAAELAMYDNADTSDSPTHQLTAAPAAYHQRPVDPTPLNEGQGDDELYAAPVYIPVGTVLMSEVTYDSAPPPRTVEPAATYDNADAMASDP